VHSTTNSHPIQVDLSRVLLAAGFDPAQRTVCLWEGVTMYLPEPAIVATLTSLATLLSPGSLLSLDGRTAAYLSRTAAAASPIRALVQRRGEPHVWGKDVPDLAPFLAAHGFLAGGPEGAVLAGPSLRAALPLLTAPVPPSILEDIWYVRAVRKVGH
jgi:O-methyltransferase involved in polyketide biosynthesis